MGARMPARLFLVRHGESTWNAEHRLQGQLDPPLSAAGREQARALAPAVARLGVPAGRTVSSDLSRARETAALIGAEPARLDPAWREIDVGEWAGRLAADVDAEDDGLARSRPCAVTPDRGSWCATAAASGRPART
jgi:broad specificity phosphatase PhoE